MTDTRKCYTVKGLLRGLVSPSTYSYNIGSEEIKRISKEFIDFLNLPIDTGSN